MIGQGKFLVFHGKADELAEPGNLAGELASAGIELEAVVSDHLDPVDPDEPPRILSSPAADARNEQVASGEANQFGACCVRHGRELRSWCDRGERAVDVEDERAPPRGVGERGEELRGLHRPA